MSCEIQEIILRRNREKHIAMPLSEQQPALARRVGTEFTLTKQDGAVSAFLTFAVRHYLLGPHLHGLCGNRRAAFF